MNQAQKLYTGEAGAHYLTQRQGAASDHVQELRTSLFADLGGQEKTILDFGCGTGGILSRLEAASRIGIEIGDEAAAVARSRGIETLSRLEDVPDRSVDVVISFHALEHVENPAGMIKELGRVVKSTGHLRLIVPAELATEPGQRRWKQNSDNHLYTWTPLLFGNLARQCGLEVSDTRLEPMPTASRAVRLLSAVPPVSRKVHWTLSRRRNALNVILNARPAISGARTAFHAS